MLMTNKFKSFMYTYSGTLVIQTHINQNFS
jgi:hypothetical protein